MAQVIGSAGWDFEEKNLKQENDAYEKHRQLLYELAFMLRYYIDRRARQDVINIVSLLCRIGNEAIDMLKADDE